jgi:diguanylate cyclase (GGDEF)-like protein
VWVVFEDFFLILASRRSVKEMWDVATSKAHLHSGAYHDVLTGLANRRSLLERFESLSHSNHAHNGAVLFIDLDRFKQANDILGHTIGDKLLVLVAERLTAAITGTNTIARIGGDEFVALLKGVSGAEEAVAIGSRLLDCLAEPFRVDGHQLLLSASVGISLYRNMGSICRSYRNGPTKQCMSPSPKVEIDALYIRRKSPDTRTS